LHVEPNPATPAGPSTLSSIPSTPGHGHEPSGTSVS
jgi:hypothetical protein